MLNSRKKREYLNLKDTVENQKLIREIYEHLIQERDDISRNKSFGLSFNLLPEEKLFNMVASNFLFQPHYYGIEIGDHDLDGQDNLKETVDTITAILESDTYQTAFEMADFTRNYLNIRSVPILIMALSINYPQTYHLIEEYLPQVLTRADEILNFFNLIRTYRPTHNIPQAFRDAMNECLYNYNELQFYKYFNKSRTKGRTKLKDVLRMTHPKPKDETYNALFKWATTGEIDPQLLPKITAIEKMKRKTVFDEEAMELLKTSKISWEFATKKFGMKKDVWNTLIHNKQLPYMASLRNIRNILKTKADVNALLSFLTNPNAVKNSRQFPQRFYNAWKTIKPLFKIKHANMKKPYYNKHVPKILNALDKAMTISTDSIPRFEGVTAIFSDNSASMSGGDVLDPTKVQKAMARGTFDEQKIQHDSEYRKQFVIKPLTQPIEIASLMSSIALRCSDKAIIGVFGENFANITERLDPNGSFFKNAEIIKGTNVGHSTNAYKAIRWLALTKTIVDRIMIFSDMQCYASNKDSIISFLSGNTAYVEDSLYNEFLVYKKLLNPNVFLYSFDLVGYGTTQFPQDDSNIVLINGFSEKVFKFVNLFEKSNIKPLDYIKNKLWKE